MKSESSSQINILLVEDDEVDIKMTESVFNKLFDKPDVFQFFVARDGMEALNKLYGREGEKKIPRPHVILLDIRMPKMGGFAFLEELRHDAAFDNVMVYILTQLYGTSEKLASQNLKIAGRIVKPILHNDALSVYTNIVLKPLE